MKLFTKITALLAFCTTLFCGITACTQESAELLAIGLFCGLVEDFDKSADNTDLIKAVVIDSYNKQKAAAQATAEEAARKDATVESIAITTQPTRTSYYIGDAFDKTGLKVTATYQSGRTADVTENVVVNGFDSSASSESVTITVTYTEKDITKSADFSVEIQNIVLTEISIEALPSKITYCKGDNFDSTGMVVKATYNNGTSATVTNYTTDFTEQNTTSGTKTITVTYGSKTTTFTVTVLEIELVSIEIVSEPTKTSYYAGDSSFDSTGMVVKANYNNGDSQTVTTYTTDFATQVTSAGSKTLTVSYGYVTTTFNITVIAVVVSSLEITTPPEKTSYYFGDSFDATGMVVTATYNNGATQQIASTECTTDFATQIESSGDKPVTVSYGGKNATFNITVISVKRIIISSEPVKKYYYTDDTFDPTGMVVNAIFEDDTKKESVTGYTTEFIEDQDIVDGIIVDVNEVKVTYGGKSAVSEIFVIEKTITSYEFTKKLKLYSGFRGTAGSSGKALSNSKDETLTSATYYKFGDWPQTIKKESVDVDEKKGLIRGALVYFAGDDGNYYVKCKENAYNTRSCDEPIKYSDGTLVQKSSANSYKYFKVEPIIWRCVDEDKKLLVAESILTADVPYYYYEDHSERNVSGTTIYANNYKYSQIRAYLNGLDYYNMSNTAVTDYSNKGFLQTAFTEDAQNKIAITTVDNSAASTIDILGELSPETKYICEDTSDKIFLLSEYEVTKYSTSKYDYNDSTRVRKPTDFAKANNAFQEGDNYDLGGYVLLRSPYKDKDDIIRHVGSDGDTGSYLARSYYSDYGVVPALCLSQW